MTGDAEARSRALLGALQEAVAAKDLAAVTDLFDDGIALFGSGGESVGLPDATAYVARVLEGDEVLRWGWEQVLPLYDVPGVLVFAVIGTVGFDGPDGRPTEERDRFRLTCLAVEREGRWRLRHFHGSIPAT